jgi:5-methylcytosine-specific restriction endonuclease McrA
LHLVPRITSELVELTPALRQWLQDEYRATLARHRRSLCSPTDLLEIRIPTILCESCFCAKVDGIFVSYRGPDVLAESWASDLAIALDEDVAAAYAEDEDAPRCQSCRRNLHGAELYVETVELSERLSVVDETAAVQPTKQRKRQILKYYGRRCFACGSDGPLGIDHIHPRSRGGTAAFQNLQPLCSRCGQVKADRLPQQVVSVGDPWPDQR